MFALVRRWPFFRRAVVVFFILPLMFAGGSLIGSLAGQSVGSVGSLEISQQEFASLFRNLEEQYRREYNLDDLPPELLRAIAQETQTRLASEYLMRAAVEEKQIYAPNASIAAEIRRMPDFQDESGQFSISLFTDYVRDPRQLETQVRHSLQRRPLLAALEAYHLPAVQQKLAAYRRQQRIVEEATISVTAVFNLTEDDVSRYYSQNQQTYQIHEEADWEYIVIALSTFSSDTQPQAEDITLAYQELIEKRGEQEQRKVSHIFISGDDDEARQRAQDLATQAQQSPDSFAELAIAHSDDAGSANNGGSLGLVVRGDLPAAMDDTLFFMQTGDISDAVEVDGGFSVLKMESSSAPPPPTLADIRDEVEEHAKAVVVRDDYFAMLDDIQEIAHINIGSLAKIAATVGVSIQTAVTVRRTADDNESPLFKNEEILSQLFVEEIIGGGETSPAIAIDDDHYLLARVVRYQPPSVRPLDEVSNDIAALLNTTEQIKLMQESGDTPDIPDNLTWRGPYTLSLTESDNTDNAVAAAAINEIFLADLTRGLPAFALVPESGTVRVFRIRQSVNEPPQENDIDVITELLAGRYSAASGSAYLDSLAQRHDIHFDVPLQ